MKLKEIVYWYQYDFNYPLYWKLRLRCQMGGGFLNKIIILYLRHIENKKCSNSGLGLPGNCCLIASPIKLYHGWCNIIIARNVEIGKNVEIFQNVTISESDKTRKTYIGDNVKIGAGAVILNNVTIGQNAKIGANSVVLCDVPPYATAVGNPARIIINDEDRD